ncbi:MAG TPA: metalloregulator ArsR/SmtB family transcription factor [Terriglobales bacterium]|nr:metalloregulator ArsR/SmtB family transcription factor [Terriglobales bacterium]
MSASKETKARGKSVSVETLLRALADRTRLRLINLMGDAELCVCYFVEVLATNQPKISRHLAYLRRAGVVQARREGLWMHYRVAVPPDSHAARILQEVRASLRDDPEMQRDLERLKKACCAPGKFVRLQSAPAPAFAGAAQENA